MKKNTTSSHRLLVKRSRAGLGLFTADPIAKGAVVIEYIGPILSNKEVEEKCGMYLFEINSRKTIDGSTRKNKARYINHSCRPNCEPEIKKGRVFIYAKRVIKAREELFYDYGKEFFNYFIKPLGCKCEKCLEKTVLVKKKKAAHKVAAK